MLTDDIAIGDNIIIFLLEPLRQRDSAATVGVIQIVELLSGIDVESIHTISVCRKNDDMDLQIENFIIVVVAVHIGIRNSFITEARFCQSKLTLDISIRCRKQIMDRVVVNRPSKHIKNLSIQLELQHLSGKDIIHIALLQHLNMLMNRLCNVSDDMLLGVHINSCLRKETRQRVHRFQVICDAHSTDIVRQKACVVDCFHDSFAVNVRMIRNRCCRRFSACCRLRNGWLCGLCRLRRFLIRDGRLPDSRRRATDDCPGSRLISRLSCWRFTGCGLWRFCFTGIHHIEDRQLSRCLRTFSSRLARRSLIGGPQTQRIIVGAAHLFGFNISGYGRAFFIL